MEEENGRSRLLDKGKTFGGEELDGLLYSNTEQVIIGTHNGPMLGEFQTGCPKMEVRYDLKRISGGEGKNNLVGRRGAELNWYKKGGCTLYIDPTSGSGCPSEVGWIDGFVTLEWLQSAGLPELDQDSVDGVLDALSVGEDYTMLFVKGILYLRTISVSYSVKGTSISGAEDLPSIKTGNMKEKLRQVGGATCTIDVDRLDKKERMVAFLSSMKYPALVSTLDDVTCVYSRMSLPACDVTFVGREGMVTKNVVPSPVMWWKGLIGLACKLGAVGDLIRAFRATRGLASWLDGLDILGVREFQMLMDIIQTKGCRRVLTDTKLARIDVVKQPTNMAASLGELVCDWGAGLEMRNMLVHVSDEFGLGNIQINTNVSNLDGCSVGDSLLREAEFHDFGRMNRFYTEMRDRMQCEVAFLGDKGIQGLIKRVGELMMGYASSGDTAASDLLLEFKNLSFTAYYGPFWIENSTRMVGEEVVIPNQIWGATTENSKLYHLKCWLDVYGLSEKVSILCGYNSLQKAAMDLISWFEIRGLIDGAEGVYVEVYREVNWCEEYKTRVGSENLEKERSEFVKIHLGIEDEVEATPEEDTVLDCCANLANLTCKESSRIVWEPPADGWIKGNTDASCIEFDEDGKGMVSIGGVFRDSNGKWIRGFMGTMGRGSIMQAELMAIKEAIWIAKDYGVNALRVESDSLAAVTAIDIKTRDDDGRDLIDEINALINSGMEVTISYQPKECNRVADQMAKKGRNRPVGVELVQEPPENVLSILAEDMRGFASS